MRRALIACAVLLLLVPAPAGAEDGAAPSYFNCGETGVKATPDNAGILLEVGPAPRVFHLTPVPAGAGRKYDGVDDTGRPALFWDQDDSAALTIDGNSAPRLCRPPAPSDKTDTPFYRAFGHDTGWSATLADGQVALVLPGRPRGIRTPRFLPALGDKGRHYKLDGVSIKGYLRIVYTPCRDPATGVYYPDTVRLEVGRRVYTGCGEPLADRH